MSLIKKHGLYESGKVVMIDINDIIPNPDQPRRSFEPNALRELAASIARYGIIQPLTVRRSSSGFELVAGERRLRASKIAGLDKVPCIILDVENSESSVLALIENLHRRDLNFIEEALALDKLIRIYGLSQEDAARRIGKSQSAVANKLRILKLSSELLYIIRESGLTERHARALLRLESDEERISALEQIINKNMNVASAEEYIESLLGKKEKPDRTASARPVYILKDVRLFINTVNRGMDMMKRSGINASYGKKETENDIILTITIPKKSKL